jgi:hypothetical protein
MATLEDAQKIASMLPGAVLGENGFGFGVLNKGKMKGFAWLWNERVDPKKARVPNPNVLAVCTPGLVAKDLLLEAEPDKYFTEPHYNGYPAVLVRLEAVTTEDLEDLLLEAWKAKAPKDLIKSLDIS